MVYEERYRAIVGGRFSRGNKSSKSYWRVLGTLHWSQRAGRKKEGTEEKERSERYRELVCGWVTRSGCALKI